MKNTFAFLKKHVHFYEILDLIDFHAKINNKIETYSCWQYSVLFFKLFIYEQYFKILIFLTRLHNDINHQKMI